MSANSNDLSQTILSDDSLYYSDSLLCQFDGFGKIDYSGALLSLAATKNSKNYPFSPVIVQRNEIELFLSSLKSNIENIKGRQISIIVPAVEEDQHWISYVMFIEDTGKISILIMDSLGDYDYLNESCNWDYSDFCCNGFVTQYINIIEESQDKDAGDSIYLAKYARQKTLKGCSVFALDDVKHVATADNYLPAVVENFPLLVYVRSRCKREERKINQPHMTALPLQFMRTAQTSYYKTILDQDAPQFNNFPEAKLMCNYNTSTIYASLSSYFFFDVDKNKYINKRLEHKLEAMKSCVEKYIQNSDENKIVEDMGRHTAQYFLSTLKNENRQEGASLNGGISLSHSNSQN